MMQYYVTYTLCFIRLLFLIYLANIVVLTEISRIMRKFVPENENY